MAEKVEWRDIPGYEGLYQINTIGEVYSFTTSKHRKPHLDSQGHYYCVSLWKNNKGRTLLIHRLVMLAFKGDSHLWVDHKNDNKLDNKLCNLEYVTPKENTKRAMEAGLCKNLLKKGNKIACKKVSQYNLDNIFIKEWSSCKAAMGALSIGPIYGAVSGTKKTAGGFIWKYKT